MKHKFELGQEVEATMIGKIKSIEVTDLGVIKYTITSFDNGVYTNALVKETQVFPLPTPKDFEVKHE